LNIVALGFPFNFNRPGMIHSKEKKSLFSIEGPVGLLGEATLAPPRKYSGIKFSWPPSDIPGVLAEEFQKVTLA
jgi:hypothetical protein